VPGCCEREQRPGINGAAHRLRRRFIRSCVEGEFQPAYPGKVYDAKDALEELKTMQAICGRERK
jgi:hypothetical protein